MRKKYTFQLVGFGKYQVIETEIKESRQAGFYWVKYQGKWQVAEWFEGKWIFINDIGQYCDQHFGKIHEERITEPMY